YREQPNGSIRTPHSDLSGRDAQATAQCRIADVACPYDYALTCIANGPTIVSSAQQLVLGALSRPITSGRGLRWLRTNLWAQIDRFCGSASSRRTLLRPVVVAVGV